MRYIAGFLSMPFICVALTIAQAARASIEGSWSGSGTIGTLALARERSFTRTGSSNAQSEITSSHIDRGRF
jgi:hypothetical protein